MLVLVLQDIRYLTALAHACLQEKLITRLQTAKQELAKAASFDYGEPVYPCCGFFVMVGDSRPSFALFSCSVPDP